MSNVSGFHDVVIYNGKQKPLTGQRLCVITFKTEKSKSEKEIDGEINPNYDPNYKRPEARCVSIPKLALQTIPGIIADAMQQCLEDLQDSVIRKLVVSALEEQKQVITVADSQINFEAIAEFAKLEAANGKLNKELIVDWFDANLGDKLTVTLATVMKYDPKVEVLPEVEKKIAAAVTLYKNTFGTLSAPKAGMSPKVAVQMHKALALVENKEDRIYKALQLKVNSYMEQKDPELVGL